jgi:outer membrane protein, heavy metal efflux system
VNRELQQMLKQILQFAEAAYASGRGLQQDVLQAQVENGKLIDEETTLVSRKRILEDQLNELVNGPGFTPVDTQGIPPLADPGLIDEVLARNAIALNPDLAALAVDIETAEVDIKLTRKNYWLDMSVALGYGLREEDLTGRDLPNFLHGSVTCILPAWFKKKQNKKLLAAMNRKAAAKPPGQRDTP